MIITYVISRKLGDYSRKKTCLGTAHAELFLCQFYGCNKLLSTLSRVIQDFFGTLRVQNIVTTGKAKQGKNKIMRLMK